MFERGFIHVHVLDHVLITVLALRVCALVLLLVLLFLLVFLVLTLLIFLHLFFLSSWLFSALIKSYSFPTVVEVPTTLAPTQKQGKIFNFNQITQLQGNSHDYLNQLRHLGVGCRKYSNENMNLTTLAVPKLKKTSIIQNKLHIYEFDVVNEYVKLY